MLKRRIFLMKVLKFHANLPTYKKIQSPLQITVKRWTF